MNIFGDEILLPKLKYSSLWPLPSFDIVIIGDIYYKKASWYL